MLTQFLAATFGTIGFSIIFHVPKKYYPICGMIGGIGWITYLLTVPRFHIVVASFFATCIVVLLSRTFAIQMRCPVTIFLISGIFSLAPGSGIYWTAYYFIMNQYQQSSIKCLETVKIAGAIVLAIIFVFEIPQGFFKTILGFFNKIQKNIMK